MKYALHSDAEDDLRDAAAFYREQAGVTLSQAFLTEIERAVNTLLRHPRLGAVWRGGKRRFLVKRFPYSIIYMTAGDEIRIFAIAHQSRHPGYWRNRTWESE